MNRRVVFLFVALVVAGFFAAHGVFSQSDSQSKRRVINLPDRSPQAAFSNAILVGDTLYISGSIGLDPKTGKAPGKNRRRNQAPPRLLQNTLDRSRLHDG